jgi:hypothetical protein
MHEKEYSCTGRRGPSGRRQRIEHGAGWQAFFYENTTDVASSANWLALGGGIPVAGANYAGDIPGGNALNLSVGNSDVNTIADFLSSGGVTYTGPGANDLMDNTMWLFFTDTIYHTAPTVSATHDDGIEVDFYTYYQQYTGFTSGPTSAISETGHYTGSLTNGQVGIIYNECCGGPAILQATVAPEPSTWAMMGLGFAALGFAGFRARKTSVSIA